MPARYSLKNVALSLNFSGRDLVAGAPLAVGLSARRRRRQHIDEADANEPVPSAKSTLSAISG
jgi:hypothetical protein